MFTIVVESNEMEPAFVSPRNQQPVHQFDRCKDTLRDKWRGLARAVVLACSYSSSKGYSVKNLL